MTSLGNQSRLPFDHDNRTPYRSLETYRLLSFPISLSRHLIAHGVFAICRSLPKRYGNQNLWKCAGHHRWPRLCCSTWSFPYRYVKSAFSSSASYIHCPLGLPGLLRPVSNATHTRSGPVARCDAGTRLQVIATIERWLDGPDKEPAVCWLNGPAGYGKSALSQTIAERYAAEGRLLGSFFFLRGAGERSHISRLIPTLAHQISLSIPATKPLLEKALRDEPALLEPSVAMVHQFQRLIIGPIHSTTSRFFSAFQIFAHPAKRWIHYY